jgi:hypothetical protein
MRKKEARGSLTPVRPVTWQDFGLTTSRTGWKYEEKGEGILVKSVYSHRMEIVEE